MGSNPSRATIFFETCYRYVMPSVSTKEQVLKSMLLYSTCPNFLRPKTRKVVSASLNSYRGKPASINLFKQNEAYSTHFLGLRLDISFIFEKKVASAKFNQKIVCIVEEYSSSRTTQYC